MCSSAARSTRSGAEARNRSPSPSARDATCSSATSPATTSRGWLPASPSLSLAPMADLRSQVEDLWAGRAELQAGDGDALAVVRQAGGLLDRGRGRVADVGPDDEVVVHQWLKEAILLLFKLAAVERVELGPFEFVDKIPLKHDYTAAGVRVVPGASARWGAFLDRGVVMMPSYVNIGARVGANTMVDTWATVGSCAQIGANVHLSGGVGIGGVLEPPQAAPVIVEDDALIGSRSMVTQGARVGRGSVLGEASLLNPGIPVIDAQTGEELGRGVVPPGCVCVRASRRRQFPGGEFGLPCLLVLKRIEPGNREHFNESVRESGVTVG